MALDTTPLRSAAQRPASFDLADFPVPTGREEEWRFTPTRRLRGLFEAEASDLRLKLIADLPDGVELVEVAADDPIRTAVPAPVDRVAVLAHAHAAGATVLRVPANAEVSRPILIERHGVGTAETTWGHFIVDIGANAAATIVLDHTGSTTFAGVLSVLVGDGAKLTLVSLQDWDDDAVHLEHHAARVGRDASYLAAVVSLGGDLVRITPTVRFGGPGASAELLGLYFADAGQHLEHRLFIDHDQPNCRSRVTYKGAAHGDSARTVWIGDVLIRANATGTDTYEENRNLLLGDRARADSVPNLEIETGEVAGAGHASTTGRFDDQQLFYLMSRGIPEDEARRLVVRGFFAEIIERIDIPEVRDRLLAAVESELAR
ncbi:MAG TPA: Fe-S cluster assembly protein SufD [Mycobacteriales bacterium]|jgi:Fe-S cluster assembly protein SufD|nr:Fe-S cluster assembly protein SufD [Mycobacteriales bacterium]